LRPLETFRTVSTIERSIYISKWIEKVHDHQRKKQMEPEKKFYGNQNTIEQDMSIASTSAKKLKSAQHESEIAFNIEQSHGYRIFDFVQAFAAIS